MEFKLTLKFFENGISPDQEVQIVWVGKTGNLVLLAASVVWEPAEL